MIKNFTFDC